MANYYYDINHAVSGKVFSIVTTEYATLNDFLDAMNGGSGTPFPDAFKGADGLRIIPTDLIKNSVITFSESQTDPTLET